MDGWLVGWVLYRKDRPKPMECIRSKNKTKNKQMEQKIPERKKYHHNLATKSHKFDRSCTSLVLPSKWILWHLWPWRQSLCRWCYCCCYCSSNNSSQAWMSFSWGILLTRQRQHHTNDTKRCQSGFDNGSLKNLSEGVRRYHCHMCAKQNGCQISKSISWYWNRNSFMGVGLRFWFAPLIICQAIT